MRNTIARTPWRRCRRLLLLLPLAAGCSVVPERFHPPQRDVGVVVEYLFDGSPRPVEVPASNATLTVLELRAEPRVAGERFEDGRRLLIPPEGTRRLRIYCRYRTYGGRGGAAGLGPLAPERLFPGATSLTVGGGQFVEQP